MGLNNSTPTWDSNPNFFGTGQTVTINEKGESVTETFHHVNGETVRQTETGQVPTNGGGFISHQSLYTTPWVAVVLVASVFLIVSTLLLVIVQRKLNKKTRSNAVVEKAYSIPLYSLNKPRSHQLASAAKWNIDLLDDVELNL